MHTWTPGVRVLRMLNGVYIRVLLRITCDERYSDEAMSDYAVRTKLAQPSIDCVLIRKRLLYVGRIACNAPPTLPWLLGVTTNARVLPWMKQIHGDVVSLLNCSEAAKLLPPGVSDNHNMLVPWIIDNGCT